eukprot:CAMPEP_0170647876 /NCGR_PEP_ID=MMETSP0224-20130122/44423_1 /TAXON_ID=285029 /ORGANISM="Togula jolla, Strain CCCM 725" /LENGTH=64 /DNA_ID=CAMNT_0010979341 /DNA_START=566 /DNA_END=756 /DNA_ORIENTATION=-
MDSESPASEAKGLRRQEAAEVSLAGSLVEGIVAAVQSTSAPSPSTAVTLLAPSGNETAESVHGV